MTMKDLESWTESATGTQEPPGISHQAPGSEENFEELKRRHLDWMKKRWKGELTSTDGVTNQVAETFQGNSAHPYREAQQVVALDAKTLKKVVI